MNTERNLLFGSLAQEAGFLDGNTLLEACRLWSARKDTPLAEVLVEQGWIEPAQRAQVEARMAEILQASAGDERAGLWATLAGSRRQELAELEDDEIRRLMHGLPVTASPHAQVTMDFAAAGGAIPTPDIRALSGPTYVLKDVLPAGPRYTRTSLHASGGMGTVWLARDTHIGRDVALKELRTEGPPSGPVPLRFLREARITGQLEHPGVVPVYELGCDAGTGQPFYAMRFVKGRTLTEVSRIFQRSRRTGRHEPLELVNLLTAFVSICNTIAYAHSHGILHRDLKGENIVLGDFGEVIVLDWGLAKRLGDPDEDLEAALPGLELRLPTRAGQTVMGQVMGTPAYLAPEQAEGRLDLVGPCSDIFGLGAILYEILTGQPPYTGTDTNEILKKAWEGEIEPPHVHWPEAPPALEAACLKALAKSPADRFATAAELAQEIQGWQDKQRRKAEDELRQAGDRLMRQQAALVALTRSEVFAGLDRDATFRQMIEVAARTIGVERVSIWRYTEDRQAIRCHLLYELSTGRYSSGIELKAETFPSYFQALLTSEVIAAHDARQDPRTCEFTESYLVPLNIGAIMDAPIHIEGGMEGVVCHEHIGPPRKWLPDEQLFAIAIANLVSQTISQWEHRQMLGRLQAAGNA
ncbi:MAG: protein kinase [Planctomycetes bacterium]|nr:protein kinase [Planctomycetota bacterium]